MITGLPHQFADAQPWPASKHPEPALRFRKIKLRE